MELNSLVIYGILMLDGVSLALQLITLAMGLGSLIFLLFWLMDREGGSSDLLRRFATRLGISTVITLIITVATPSTQQAVIILGLPMLLHDQKAAIQEVRKTPLKFVQILTQYLDTKK